MKILLIFIIIIILIIVWITLFIKINPVFWWKSEIFQSKNFINWKFQNISKTSIQTWSWGFLWTVKNYILSKEQRTPLLEIPTIKFNKNNFKNWDFVWFGHSTILMNIDEKNILTDPVFYKASPVFIWWKPFNYSYVPKISDLPNIDTVLISHDHYDHLDYQTISELDNQVKNYIVPLWVKSHLLKWWVEEAKIVELDWYENISSHDIDFIFTPAQHFSWRAILNGWSTLWWSWVVKWKETSIFFSGDSWYFDWFKKIWEKYGPFDIAFIENGAYDDAWNGVHMYPEQSVQASIDLNAKNVMPIHWWKFDLSLHSWYDPIERFVKESNKLNVEYFHPKIWENFKISNLPKRNWWSNLK